MKSIILLTVVLASCSRTPDAIVIDVPTDSTFVPHKFLSGELARLNNEIEALRDSLASKPATFTITWCDDQLEKGEIIGAFNVVTTECNSGAEGQIPFYIIWDGDRAITKRAPTLFPFNFFPEPPLRKS